MKIPWFVVVGFLFVGPAAVGGDDLRALVEILQSAERNDRFGALTGWVLTEPGARAVTPLPNARVRLYPASPEFTSRLEELRAHARDGATSYLTLAKRLEESIMGYEERLSVLGAHSLVQATYTNGDGFFEFPRVPEGKWRLLAWADTEFPVASRKTVKPKGPERFLPQPPADQYVRRDFWSVPIEIRAGELRQVELTDRNRWASGVIQ